MSKLNASSIATTAKSAATPVLVIVTVPLLVSPLFMVYPDSPVIEAERVLSATVIVYAAPASSEAPPPPVTCAAIVEDEPLGALPGTVIVAVAVPLAPAAKDNVVPELADIQDASKKTEKSSLPFPPLVTV